MSTTEIVAEGALTIANAETFCGLGRTYLYGLMSKGELRYVKVGKRRLIPRAELVRLLAAGVVGGEPTSEVAGSRLERIRV